jgi:Cu/Ag efflux protein CusF
LKTDIKNKKEEDGYMKKMMMSIFSIFCMLFIFGLSIATEQTIEHQEVIKVKERNTLKGKVNNVDLETKTITVNKRNKDFLITVNDETKISRGKESKSLTDVNVGDKIRVTYSEVDGERIAKNISIRQYSQDED